jgi:hypothetical protein
VSAAALRSAFPRNALQLFRNNVTPTAALHPHRRYPYQEMPIFMISPGIIKADHVQSRRVRRARLLWR